MSDAHIGQRFREVFATRPTMHEPTMGKQNTRLKPAVKPPTQGRTSGKNDVEKNSSHPDRAGAARP